MLWLLIPGAAEGEERWEVKLQSPWRARGARAYNGGLGGRAPSRVQGQSPWSGGLGRSLGAKPPPQKLVFFVSGRYTEQPREKV